MSNLYLLASNVLATLPGQVLEEKFVISVKGTLSWNVSQDQMDIEIESLTEKR